MQIDILKPKDLVKCIKALTKLKGKCNTNKYISWNVTKDKQLLTLTFLADEGTLYNKSFEILEPSQDYQCVTDINNINMFDCNSNESIVSIIIKDNNLYISDALTKLTIASKLLDMKYYIKYDPGQDQQQIKYYNLTKLKQLLAGINVKDSHNMIGINVNNNILSIITNDLNTSLMRCK